MWKTFNFLRNLTRARGDSDIPLRPAGQQRLRLKAGSRLVPLWRELVETYAECEMPAPGLRLVTLAQWAHESNWGTSELAIRHNNFGGIKYRDRMAGHASPVRYAGRLDGLQTYCRFQDVDTFIRGYWHFIQSGSYRGWQRFEDRPMAFIAHLKARGYAEDPQYVEKIAHIYQGFRNETDVAAASGSEDTGPRSRVIC